MPAVVVLSGAVVSLTGLAVPIADADCSGGTPDAADAVLYFKEWLAGGC